jgi:Uma2 family endonuclease
MAGVELEHDQIAQNVRSELTAALADRPCHIVGSDQRVHVEAVGEYFYPNILVTCLEPRERYDRGDKWLAYRTISSLTDYVMISSTRREVEHYQRMPDGSWLMRPPQRDGESVLASGVVLDVHRLYRLVPGLG